MMIGTTSAGQTPTGFKDRRYFVTVHAADTRSLRRVADFGLDFFQATARQQGDVTSVEGLISLEDAVRLVDAGYRVTLEADEQSRSRASETAGLNDWLAQLGEV